MAIVQFIIELMGATMLLLYAVRMVRTGIERSFGARFREVMTGSRNRFGSALVGLGFAVVLQSSAAVALLASGFAAAGFVGFGTGLSLILGADLGSALIIQILSFDLSVFVPVLLAVGGWFFVKTERRGLRQTGRILMGIAFILISLQFLRNAVDPIRESAFLPAISGYLEADYLTAFIVGAVLAFVMHSSVAAILVLITLVQIGTLPLGAGLSIMLGANLGSGLIAVWLTRGMPAEAVRLPMANLILRGGFALLALVAVNKVNDVTAWSAVSAWGPGQTLVFAHILYNVVLLLISLPAVYRLEPLVKLIVSDRDTERSGSNLPPPARALVGDADTTAKTAIVSLTRELLRMSELVERMFLPVIELYRNNDPDLRRALREIEDEVDASLSAVRAYVAALPVEEYTRDDTRMVRGLMDYAIRLESAGDVVVVVFTRLSAELHKAQRDFSDEGWKEITRLHAAIVHNLRLANNVLVSDDVESARLLVEEKSEVKRAERKSRKRHLDRLRAGNIVTFESSNVHLETIRALRDFNSHIAAIAYPTLYRAGQLLETRLINDVHGVRKA